MIAVAPETAPATHPRRAAALRGQLSALSQAARPRPGAARRWSARWSRLRTTVLTIVGFSFLVAAAFTIGVTVGLVAAGAAVLLLEVLGGEDRP